MKRQLATLILSSALSSLFGTVTLSAQDQQEVAKIPFSYRLGSQMQPAGKYTVFETGSLGLFRLRNAASGESLFVSSSPEGIANGVSKLVFINYGGEYALSQIWINGNGYNVKARPLPREASNRMGLAAMVSVPLTSR